MQKQFDFTQLISLLENCELVLNIENIHVDEISQRGLYKIKCRLIPAEYLLEIKYVKTKEDITYSYQVYADTAIARWDNAPHYPNMETFPHHFHDRHGKVTTSHLSGYAKEDLKRVLNQLREILLVG